MFVRGLGTAHPKRRYTKADCLTAFQSSSWFGKLDRRARTIAELVLTGDNGIDSRHLALDSLEEVFAIDPDTLHARFSAHAPRLAADAAAKAMQDASLEPEETRYAVQADFGAPDARVRTFVSLAYETMEWTID